MFTMLIESYHKLLILGTNLKFLISIIEVEYCCIIRINFNILVSTYLPYVLEPLRGGISINNM